MPLSSKQGRRAPSFSEGGPGSAEESYDPQYQLLVDEALVPTSSVARAAIITREDNTVLAGTQRFKVSRGDGMEMKERGGGGETVKERERKERSAVFFLLSLMRGGPCYMKCELKEIEREIERERER
jgi:hypothetical protein